MNRKRDGDKKGRLGDLRTRVDPSLSPAPASARLADLLDTRFRVPGTSIRFGLDAVIGLIPVVGDTLTSVLALTIVAEAYALGARKRVLAKMLWNVGVDWVIGLVPVLDIFLDVWFKGNARNIRLLRREWEAGRLEKPRVKPVAAVLRWRRQSREA